MFKTSFVLKKFKKKDPFEHIFGDGIHPKELEIHSKELDTGMILKKNIIPQKKKFYTLKKESIRIHPD